tara:strand:+ start:16497 stop:17021 length:525 start_codon:yes stop_codon:yes gene_type:complete
MKAIFRKFSHILFRTRPFVNKHLKKFAKNCNNKKILELGSGKSEKGKHSYSSKKFFNLTNDFLQTDMNPDFGHKVLDATKMNYKNEFDVILCLNVLEHVYEFQKAIDNIHAALKPQGTLLFFVPGYYPLHDEPHDYWRFTEHSLKKIFQNFSNIKISHSGVRQYPFGYFIEANK